LNTITSQKALNATLQKTASGSFFNVFFM